MPALPAFGHCPSFQTLRVGPTNSSVTEGASVEPTSAEGQEGLLIEGSKLKDYFLSIKINFYVKN